MKSMRIENRFKWAEHLNKESSDEENDGMRCKLKQTETLPMDKGK